VVARRPRLAKEERNEVDPMSLTGVVLLCCLLACPAGMGLMMWFMGRGPRGQRSLGSRREEPDA